MCRVIQFRPSCCLWFALALALAAAPGCKKTKGQTGPPVEPDRCGEATWEILPGDQVGEIVSEREDALSPLAAPVLDALVSQVATAFSPLPYGAQVHYLRYTTQNQGQRVEATGLLSLPHVAPGDPTDFPIVLWLHPLVGVAPACAPSAGDLSLRAPLLILSALGFIVVAPDYIGLDADAPPGAAPDAPHALLNAEQVALGSLDMVQAVRKVLPQLGGAVTWNGDLALWGISQGGHAVLATELYAPHYAPDLPILAAIAAIPPTDLIAIGEFGFDNVSPATAGLAGFLVTNHPFYGGAEPYTDLFTNDPPGNFATVIPERIYQSCDPGDTINTSDATQVSDLFAPSFLADPAADPWGCYGRANSPSRSQIPVVDAPPTLMIVGEDDDLAYAPAARADVGPLCDRGFDLQYVECAGAGHVDAAQQTLIEQIRWLERHVRDREPVATTGRCQVTTPVDCTTLSIP